MAKGDGNILDERDYQILQVMADKNLNVNRTADKLWMHRKTVLYHVEKIKRITGLDARKFHDMRQLLVQFALVPGPREGDDHNITEICFLNGKETGKTEMKQAIISKLMEQKTKVNGVYHSQLVDMIEFVEGL